MGCQLKNFHLHVTIFTCNYCIWGGYYVYNKIAMHGGIVQRKKKGLGDEEV